MKKLNSGFTLAEVLITLGIIGVVAAIVLPAVMSNYQYKSVGVKLAKFVSTVEGSARAFAVNNDNFAIVADRSEGAAEGAKISNVTDFINESFIFKTFDPEEIPSQEEGKAGVKILSYPVLNKLDNFSGTYLVQSGDTSNPIAILKDGTAIQVFLDNEKYTSDHLEIVPVEKYGVPIFRINFDPKVQGLPATSHKNFNFTVTELGYVFPHEKDDCLWDLYNNGFNTTSKDFAAGKTCHEEQ